MKVCDQIGVARHMWGASLHQILEVVMKPYVGRLVTKHVMLLYACFEIIQLQTDAFDRDFHTNYDVRTASNALSSVMVLSDIIACKYGQ